MREKRAARRRDRARALFLALERAWEEQYAERSTAMAVHHYGGWYQDGAVSATWLARLASEPWLSTQESRFRPAPPRELTVLTQAAFEIEGEHPEKYVHEIDAERNLLFVRGAIPGARNGIVTVAKQGGASRHA